MTVSVDAAGVGQPVVRQSTLEIRPLTRRIGAEILDVDLAAGVSDQTFGAIQQALVAQRVLFFRNQRLNREAQIKFAQRFGPLTQAHPTMPSVEGVVPLLDIDSLDGAHADNWHTDATYIDRPPDFSILRAVVLPGVGGDTIWASTVAGYESLRFELRQLAEQLRTVHTNSFDYARLDLTESSDQGRRDYRTQFVSTVFETEHPLVRVHPVTGERALLLGGFTQRVVGYNSTESVDLIRLFQSHITKPENTVRWQWKDGDVVIWDNRSTQHYATYDYGTSRRRMQRVTTVGTIPIGVDGQASRSLKGDASDYSAGVL